MYRNLKVILSEILNSRYFYHMISAVIVVNVFVMYLILRNAGFFQGNQAPNFATLSNGVVIENHLWMKLQQNGIYRKKGNIQVIVFIDVRAETHKRILSYLNLVHDRLANTGTQFNIIVPVSSNRVRDLVELLDLKFNIVPDQSGYVYNLLKIKQGDSGIVIVNKDNSVKFVMSPLPPEEYIRQFIEVTLYGASVTVFNPEEQKHLTREKLLNLRVYDVISKQYTTLAEGIKDKGLTLVTFFDGFCPGCSAYEERLETIRTINSIQSDISGVVFVFKSSASEFELRAINESNGQFNVYQTNEVMFPELEYMARELSQKHFRTVLVDPDLNIMFLENQLESDSQLTNRLRDRT